MSPTKTIISKALHLKPAEKSVVIEALLKSLDVPDPKIGKIWAAEAEKRLKTAKKEDMRKEYRREDLGVGVRGKYYHEFKKGTNLVLLSPDIAAAFPDDDSVNSALRSLLKIARHSLGPAKRSTRIAKKQAVG